MTPGARVAAAIEVLDEIAGGQAAEQALTRWGRSSRYAGSKDRAAVRDHVFDVLRRRRSAARLGGGETGRALMIGSLRAQAIDLEDLFNGVGHAPAPLNDDEAKQAQPDPSSADTWNFPDWLIPLFQVSLGDKAEDTAQALQDRAPIVLRVNLAKGNRDAARAMLAADEVPTAINPLADTALTVTGSPRKVRNSAAYSEGYVELQDAASQAVVAAVPKGGRVLDFCAGGGGKALALAMDGTAQIFAHDIDPRRMADLPHRAGRAGASVMMLETDDLTAHAPFDTVLCDAPCSGSGAWRRAPEGKWTLTEERLAALCGIQDDILDQAAALTASTGTLVFATCSVLRVENEDRIAAFLTRHPDWQQTFARRFDVGPDGDGFFTAHLTRQ